MVDIIVNADDFGVHPETNRGILDSYTRGVLTSASLLMTTPYTEQTINEIAIPEKMPVGIHLCLTLGWAVSLQKHIPNLVNHRGEFYRRAIDLIMYRGDPNFWKQVEIEFTAQIQFMLSSGIRPTHIDTHQHIHLNPNIFSIITELCNKFDVPAMRIGIEPLWLTTLTHRPVKGLLRVNILKWMLAYLRLRNCQSGLKTTDRYFGFLHSGTMDAKLMQKFLHAVDSKTTWEIACHPGYPVDLEGQKIYPQPEADPFMASHDRAIEMDALCNPRVVNAAQNSEHKLINFTDL